MTSHGMSEAEWEALMLDTLGEQAWRPVRGDQIAPGTDERTSWDDLVIPSRLMRALQLLNPTVPGQYLQQAFAEIVAPKSRDAITENHRLHAYLVEGFRGITYIDSDGLETTPTIRLVRTDPDDNDWLAANQVTLVAGDYRRRLDVVLYCNGLPVSIVELKRAGSAQADVAAAHAQLQTYLREFPLGLRYCVFTLVSDGIIAKYGTPFTPLNHFSPWNVDDDGTPVGLGTKDAAGPGHGADGGSHPSLRGCLSRPRWRTAS